VDIQRAIVSFFEHKTWPEAFVLLFRSWHSKRR
jgi:hypothetical protein